MKFRIPPQTHLERLKLSAMYLSLQRGLKRSGWGSVGWGLFTLAFGLLSGSHRIFDTVWFLIGLFLLLEGAWILRAASLDPRVLRLEAIALLILGLWNTVGFYWEVESGIKPLFGARIIFVGIFQLIGAYTTFRSYPAYKNIYAHLDHACLHELEVKIGDMWKRKTQAETDLVEFKVDDKKCKARFLPEQVILLVRDGKQIVLAQREEVKVEKTGDKLLSKQVKVSLTLEDEKLKGQMDPACYERWQAWLSQSSPSKETT